MSYKETFNPCDECNYSYSKLNEVSSMCKICEFNEYLVKDRDGRLVELPCKPGSTVYVIENNTDVCLQCSEYVNYDYGEYCNSTDESYVLESEVPVCNKQHYHIVEKVYSKEKILYNLEYFDKTWFIDRDKAVAEVIRLNDKRCEDA